MPLRDIGQSTIYIYTHLSFITLSVADIMPLPKAITAIILQMTFISYTNSLADDFLPYQSLLLFYLIT